MKGLLLVLAMSMALFAFGDTETVTNVRGIQRENSKLVDIYYDLNATDYGTYTVGVEIEGRTIVVTATTFTGDVGEGVTRGTNRHIIWDAGADWPNKKGDVKVVVTVTKEDPDVSHGKVQLWEGGPYWADRNIGADNPLGRGLYFWWGDTTGHSPSGTSFSFNFYLDNSVIYTYGKSVSELKSAGWVTSGGVLAPSHDAAHVKWGGSWRMPTYQELYDLCYNKCDWTWTTTNGVNGYIVHGRGAFASRSIFLPWTGFGYGTTLHRAGSYGSYWSSVPDSGNNSAGELYFDSGFHRTISSDGDGRFDGRAVRPVQGFTSVGSSDWFFVDTTDGALTLVPESADWWSGSITLRCTDGDTSSTAHTYSLFYEDASGNLVAVEGENAVNVSADANGNVHLIDTAFSSRLDGIKPVKYHVKDEKGRVSEACETRNRHAIFVGLNEWRNADLESTWGDRDANNFFNIAALRGGFNNSDNIHVLLNSGAKADDVDDAFNRVAESVQTGDIFLFYFNTHGGYDKSDGTTFLCLYDDDYTDTALAKKIQAIEATDKSIAIIGIVSACHAGGMYDPDARQEHWYLANGLARCTANIAWITAADREHNSSAAFDRFLLDYGWEEGWAGNGVALSFQDLATYTKDRYETLLSGIKSYQGREVQIENPPLLGKVMAGTRGSHANKNPPAAVTGIKAETGDRVDEIKAQWNAVDNADEYWLFCETGGVNEVCAAYSCPARETEVIMSFQKLFGESEFDPSKLPIKYSVKAVNGAGVSAASTVEVRNFVRIVFDANGGGISGWRGALPHEGIVYADITLGSILGGRLLTLPDAYGDSNKEFTGWFSNGTQADPRAPIVSDETYFAHWEAKNTHGMTQDWLDRHQTIATASNGDIATAAAMTAANGCRTVGECYALGIDPEDPDDDLRITAFRKEDGQPVITVNHTTDGSGNSFANRIRTLGKKSLMDAEWVDITDMDQSEYRFFKVAVELDDGDDIGINMDDFEIENGVLKAYVGDAEEVVIPSNVTSIGDCAFQYRDRLTSVTILDGVTKIGEFAFAFDSNLTRVTIPGSVKSIGRGAFAFCDKLATITIPEGVTSIDYGAFAYCYELAAVTIPESVTNIGYGAFVDCHSLTNVTFKGNAPSVVSNSFDGVGGSCTVHVNRGSSGWGVAIPGTWNGMRIEYADDGSGDSSPANDDRANAETLTGTSGTRSFSTVDATTEDDEPTVLSCEDSSASVWFKWTAPIRGRATFSTAGSDFDTVLGVYRYDTLAEVAFNDDADDRTSQCSFLAQAGQTYYVAVAGYGASGAAALSWECDEGGTPVFTIDDGVLTAVELNGAFEVTIPGTVREIGESTFEGCDGLMSVVMSNGVTSIGAYAFGACTSLENLVLPSSLTNIGEFAFSDCVELTSVTIPEGVVNIDWGAFYDCMTLENIALPGSLVSIGEEAFGFCGRIESFTVPNDNPSYKAVNGMLMTKDGKTLIHGVNGDVTIPNGVVHISDSAFACCDELTDVVIPSGVQVIGDCAFYRCDGLTSVSIPNSVTNIGSQAFLYCRGLADENGFVIVRDVLYGSYGNYTEIVVPQGVATIEDSVFIYKPNLTKVSIPSSVSKISSYAFYNCSNLTNVTFEGNAPSLGIHCFDRVGSACTVYVSQGSSGWGVTIPGTWNGMAIRFKEDDK